MKKTEKYKLVDVNGVCFKQDENKVLYKLTKEDITNIWITPKGAELRTKDPLDNVVEIKSNEIDYDAVNDFTEKLFGISIKD